MQLQRRIFLQLAAGVATLPAVSPIATAQTYPMRPITMIEPYPAGSSIGRLLAERMSGFLGQPIIIENVSGADGSIGAGRAARARPDGYTIVIGFLGSHVLNGALYSLQYDVLNDFAPISPVYTTTVVLFGKKMMPWKDLKELIVWLRANPNKASAGFFAAGGRLVASFFQKETGTQFTLVPYRGLAPLVQDLVAGQIDVAFSTPDFLPPALAGSIKAYGIASDTRLALAPDIPTFAGMGLPGVLWSAFWPSVLTRAYP
jgi:tripartite-type tricarboxylate transporter receptor subunit TctC